ncbi:MAG: hypothetical protein NTU79_08875 [Planctomycetota bacterium]|nr:hypothetical protein [Planctomycetota bacterium]
MKPFCLFSTNALKSICFVVGLCSIASTLQADDDFEHPPISYQDSPSRDPVARLLERIQSGDESLVPDSNGNYLKSLLQALNVPETSQCLVFSKTSMQILHIGPRTPRAIYFNDSTYVGMVVGSPILELAAIDPQLGSVFYTLERDEKSFRIIRDRGQCLSCHATSRTERVPGVLVRSIYSDRSGRPRSGSSTYITDHRSPFEQRWGGWYVTGQHGTMRHLGNIFADDRDDPQKVDMEAGANCDQLPKAIRGSDYLQDTSDIVALMVLEHQTRVHNLITRANYEARQATYLDRSMNVALGRASDFVSESTQRRVASVGEALLGGLLFADEVELSSPIEGSPGFVQEFQARGPVDSKGRSFYQLDLKRRMFRYPCSFLILSEHFEGLPEPVSHYVRSRLREILAGRSKPPQGVRLSKPELDSIRMMLSEFKPGWLEEDPLQEAGSP